VFTRAWGLFCTGAVIASIGAHIGSIAGVSELDDLRWVSTAASVGALVVLALGLAYQRVRRRRLVREAGSQVHDLGRLPAPLADRLDEQLLPLVTSARVVGLTVGIHQDGTHSFRAHGTSGTPRPLDERSVFEIGSITKTFTAILLADMVLRGELSLEDEVRDLLPGVQLRREGTAATVLDLATHHAGLPRIAPSMLPAVFSRSADPYARWDEHRLERWAREVRPRRRPGTRFGYSNFGFALLGLCLSRVARRPYTELVGERILGPLKMADTHFEPSPQEGDRAVQGHDYFGAPTRDWHMAAIAPAGGIRSTAADMSRYLAAQIVPDRAPLADAIRFAHQPRREVTPGLRSLLRRHPVNEESRIGLAWITTAREGSGYRWHNGGTGGFGSFIGFGLGARTGVLALSNSSHAHRLDAACFEIVRAVEGSVQSPRG
jgi:CubicO group peptidase (beta-lactamase class C family)